MDQVTVQRIPLLQATKKSDLYFCNHPILAVTVDVLTLKVHQLQFQTNGKSFSIVNNNPITFILLLEYLINYRFCWIY